MSNRIPKAENMMKKTTLVAGALLVLAGCSDGGAPVADHDQAASPVQAVQSVTPAPAAVPCTQDGFYSPLPDPAIRFGFPFRVARDSVYASDQGKPRRRLSLDYLEGSPEDVWNGIVRGMQAAGFEPVADAAPGEYSATFSKGGQPGIFAKLTPGPGTSPTGDDVKGSIWLSWPLKEAAGAP
jgi:hypothetical protein